MHRQAQNLTLAVLARIGKGIELVNATKRYQSIFAHEGFDGVRRMLDEENERNARRRLREMKRQKLFVIKKKGDDLVCTLTEKGKMMIITDAIKRSKPLNDGSEVFVLYDFPEAASNARDAFRYLLKRSGFKRLQRSVWFSQSDVAAHLSDLVRERKLERWVTVITAKRQI